MPLDRGSEYDETKPKSIEQQIDETRPERDAFRADPRNWHRVDFTNRPDFLDKWGLEPEPYTPEELELAKQYEAEEANVDYEAAGEIYTDEHGNLRPEYAWLVHEGPPPEGVSLAQLDRADAERQRPRDTASDRPAASESTEGTDAGDSLPESTDSNLGEIADGLRAGELTPQEAQQELFDLPSAAPWRTTEVVRTEGDKTFEVGTPEVDADSFGEKVRNEESDKVALHERQRNEGIHAGAGLSKPVQEGADRAQSILSGERPPTIAETRTPPGETMEVPQVQGHSWGDIGSLAVVGWVIGSKASDKVAERYLLWYWQADGSDDDDRSGD